MKSKRQIKSEKLWKNLGKWKKHNLIRNNGLTNLDGEIKKEVVYRTQRKRSIYWINKLSTIVKKIIKQPLILQKRQNLQHPTIKNLNHRLGTLDMFTYNVMLNSYKKFMKKHNLIWERPIDELIQLRIDSTDPISAKNFLLKHLSKGGK